MCECVCECVCVGVCIGVCVCGGGGGGGMCACVCEAKYLSGLPDICNMEVIGRRKLRGKQINIYKLTLGVVYYFM